MNNFTKTLAAILANTALVWGGCLQEPDLDGLVTLPATWTFVPAKAFLYCAKLEKVVIPKGVKDILELAFANSGLEVIEFEPGSELTSIGTNAFTVTPMKSIVIPQGVKRILDNGFRGSRLEVIDFGVNSQLETIGRYAFLGNPMKSIVIPQGVKELPYAAFSGTGLEVIEFEPGSELKIIGPYAFSGSKKLKVIEFEVNSQLETFGKYAFYGSSIVSIVIPSGVTPFDANNVFEGTPCNDKKSVQARKYCSEL